MMNKDPHLAIVVAHYHARGKLSADLFNLVKHIATLTNNIVFVSTNINPDEVSRISPYAKVISRANFGHDFWSYKVGIDALGDLSGFQRIICFNSSFVTFDPQGLCQKFLQPVTAPVLRGLTISNEITPHVQSYWFAFEHPLLIGSVEFKQWWEGMAPLPSRKEVIMHCELGMSEWFLSHGFKIDALFKMTFHDYPMAIYQFLIYAITADINFKTIRLHHLGLLIKAPFVMISLPRFTNPTYFAWQRLYQELKILKKDLLISNPLRQNLSSLYRDADAATLAIIKDVIEN